MNVLASPPNQNLKPAVWFIYNNIISSLECHILIQIFRILLIFTVELQTRFIPLLESFYRLNSYSQAESRDHETNYESSYLFADWRKFKRYENLVSWIFISLQLFASQSE